MVYYFFLKTPIENTINMTWWGFFRSSTNTAMNKAYFHTTRPLFRDVRFLKDYQNSRCLEAATEGAYKPIHPIYGNVVGADFVAEGQLTHGQGSIQNPSKLLHHTDIKGNQPQNYIPFEL